MQLGGIMSEWFPNRNASSETDEQAMSYDEMEAELTGLAVGSPLRVWREMDGAIRHYAWNHQDREISVTIEPDALDDLTLLFDCWHGHYVTIPANSRYCFERMNNDLLLLVRGEAMVYELKCGGAWLQRGMCKLDPFTSLRDTVIQDTLRGIPARSLEWLKNSRAVAHCRFWDSARDQRLSFEPEDWMKTT